MSWKMSALCALGAILVACASPRPIEPFDYRFDAGRGRFEPTRVVVNRNVPVSPHYFDRLDALVTALRASDAFLAFGADVESRSVLDLTLERLSDDSFSSMSAGGGPGGYRGGVGVGVAVPVTGGRHTHRLTAVLYRDGESVAAFRYVGDFDTAWKLAGRDAMRLGAGEQRLIANLVNRLVADLDRGDALPRATTTAD